jgi:xylulokinase
LGERTLGSPHSRASFIGATIGHERAHFVRAVMEGIALEDRRALECLCPAGVHGPIRASGGGASSSLWNQIRADVFAHPVQVLASAEGGIQGAAILAGVAAGWYSDAAAGAEEVVRVAETWAPSPDAVRVYEDAFRIFCAVHDALDGHWQAWDDRIK